MSIRLGIAAAALATCLAPVVASAAAVNLNTHYSFGFQGSGTSIEGTAGGGYTHCTNPACTASPVGTTFEFTLPSAGTLTVLDLFIKSDRFEIFDSTLGSLGMTSAPAGGGDTCGSDFTCALADAGYSRGIFNLAAGNYSISGRQTAGIAGAGAFIVEVAAIPLPATLPLLALAIGGIAAARRRKAA